jgi:hypothetical protein
MCLSCQLCLAPRRADAIAVSPEVFYFFQPAFNELEECELSGTEVLCNDAEPKSSRKAAKPRDVGGQSSQYLPVIMEGVDDDSNGLDTCLPYEIV